MAEELTIPPVTSAGEAMPRNRAPSVLIHAAPS
jgi:hypothetical protein